MKKSLIVVTVLFAGFLIACGGEEKKAETNSSAPATTETTATSENPSYDPVRGEGKFKDVEIPETLNPTLAAAGEKVYSVKCSSCHKLTDEKLVGPGFSGVTSRHTAEWIMNFATNPDPMINKDPKVQAMLELCLVRMPNQNLADEDARNVYEFMRKNDGVK
jgi:mono/diheme cytochrome c family protein